MDRNTVLGLVLIFAIMIGYMYMMQPSKEELEERRLQDSIQRAELIKRAIQDSILQAQRDSIALLPDSLKPEGYAIAEKHEDQAPDEPKKRIVPKGPFSHAAIKDSAYYILENDLLKIKVASLGGRPVEVELKEFQTFDSLPLILFKEEANEFSISFFYERQTINTGDYFFKPVWYDTDHINKNNIKVSSGTIKFGMRLYPYDTIQGVTPKSYIEFQYTLEEDSYIVGFEVIFSEMQDFIAPQTERLPLRWSAELRRQEKTIPPFNGPTIYYSYPDKKVESLHDSKDDDMKEPVNIKWLSFKQAFFTSVLIAEESFTNAEGSVKTIENHHDPRYLRSMEATIGLPYRGGEYSSIPMSFYFGPNKYTILRDYDLALERQIPLGWSFFLMHWINRGAVIPIFNWLEKTGLSYGIIILILTILLKIALFPIAYKMFISSAKMRALKPEIDEISKKYPKREDAMKKQQAVMALYKSVGVNPMAGCVPVLLQLPILLAMFRFFPSSIELRQQSFLWAHDLSTYDSIINLGFTIPVYGDHVSLFTLLMAISTFIYTRLNNQMMAGSTQMPGLKMMMYFMPVMLLFIFNSYSSGLSYYYFLTNIITFGQMAIMRRFVDEEKLRSKLQAKKQKPVKKSKFQQRLEEAQKAQQRRSKRRK